MTANPWALLLVPLSQASGVLGHLLFELSHIDTRDAVFSWRVLVSLHRMFVLLLAGRYGRHVELMRRRLAEAHQGHAR